MPAPNPKAQLKGLLRELFQLSNSDLHFGIYRILGLKSREVEDFINNRLDARIEEVKNRILARQGADIDAGLEAAKRELTEKFQISFEQEGDLETKAGHLALFPAFAEPYRKYTDARARKSALRLSEDAERAIYNDLYRFFERYYEEGDFVSKPRAGAATYMIPYGGEEVKLYWANYDQYYIKTGENFKSYAFNNAATTQSRRDDASDSQGFQPLDAKTGYREVVFKLLDADTAQNNNKEEKGRRFVPAGTGPADWYEWDADAGRLSILFRYKAPDAAEKERWGDAQSVKTEAKGINQRLLLALADALRKDVKDAELARMWDAVRDASGKGDAVPLFQYHLERYTTVNKFDYFIHKDLRGFLGRELDYFLKNEVFSIRFLDLSWKEDEVQEAIRLNVLRAGAIRDLGLEIIAFLGELEDFQKRLFEKKKFVVQSDYCLTLDRLPAAVYADVMAHTFGGDKSGRQLAEWKALGFTDAAPAALKKALATLPEAGSEDAGLRHLVLDTAFLPDGLKWRLLAGIEDLDAQTDGLLINSENWQALNFLGEKYAGKVKCTYIDPPYNTGSDGFVYKDALQSSTWLTMMETRLALNRALMPDDGCIFTSIDDTEHSNLVAVKEKVFGQEDFVSNIIWQKKFSPQNDAKWLSDNHDFVVCFAKDKLKWRPVLLLRTELANSRYSNPDNDERGDWTSSDITVRTYSPEYDYPIETPSGKNIYPTKGRCWFTNQEEFGKLRLDNRIWFGTKGDNVPRLKNFLSEVKDGITPLTIWTHDEVGHNQEATQEIKHKGITNFSSPKTTRLLQRIVHIGSSDNSIVLDYFAGSGTTGEAVIRNSNDANSRKYILCEMGKYFDTVTKPRIQKVVFSDKWKDGRPAPGGAGVSHIFQYLRLEQYEDTLNNIAFARPEAPIAFTSPLQAIRYELGWNVRGSGSLINIQKFAAPFPVADTSAPLSVRRSAGYTLDIVQQNEPKETVIDLITTFNFLLGIEVVRYRLAEHGGTEYRIVHGRKGQQAYLIIWRPYTEGATDLAAEHDWITEQDWWDGDAVIFCNADNAFGAGPTEAEMLRLMMAPPAA